MLWFISQFLLAGLAAGTGLATEDVAVSSPSLDATSDKNFLDKDYPADKRPPVDVLHFKHPYPVVQDSDDFDKDFVKDENSDGGAWKAQMEYDRLRHKLLKEKGQVAKALQAKTKAENELKEAMERHEAEKAKQKAQEVEKSKDKEETKEKEERKHGLISGPTDAQGEKVEHKYVVPRSQKTPGGVTSPGEVNVATGDTNEAMERLEECKKQLAKARDDLRRLMKELEVAKKQQHETQAALDAASERLKALEASHAAAEAATKKEYQEYLDAKNEYEKEQAIVAKMEADIKAAAAKVKAMRDSADKDGGVYPTRSGAPPHSVAPLLSLILVASSMVFFQ